MPDRHGRTVALLGAIAIAWTGAQPLADWDNPADRYLESYRQYESATCPFTASEIRHFVYFARDRNRIRDHAFLEHPGITGAQIMYSWAELEPERDRYDFAVIEADLGYLESYGKKLFIQLQDTTFSDEYVAVPTYLRTSEFDGGAIRRGESNGGEGGWVAKRWIPDVRARFAKLMSALGEQFDGRIEGINLQESAIGVSSEHDTGFDASLYARALKDNMRALKEAFPKSTTMQYANFMPGEWLPWEDEGYLRGLYRYGEEIGVGLGGPDLMVRRRGQLNHTLALMHEHEYSVPLGIAVQDGNYIGQTGADGEIAGRIETNRKNIVPMLYEFARDFLHVDYMFWVDQAPYFEEDVLPCLLSGTPGKVLQDDSEYSVLLIGNSHSTRGNLPAVLEQLLEIGAGTTSVNVEVADGRAFLAERLSDTTTQKTLESGSWTHVVLQAQKYSTSGKYVYPTDAAEEWIRRSRSLGAQAVLFPEWARRGNGEEGVRVHRLHMAIASREPACVAPIGLAWETMLETDPYLRLHHSDGNHANRTGALLTAYVLYATITGRSAMDLPDTSIRGVPAERQASLRAAADRAVSLSPPCVGTVSPRTSGPGGQSQ